MLERRNAAARAFDELSSFTSTILIETGQGVVRRSVSYSKPGSWRVEDGDGLLLLRTPDIHLKRGPEGTLQRLPQKRWWPDEEIGYLGWGHPDFLLGATLIRSDEALTTHRATGREVRSELFDMQGKRCALETDSALGILLSQSTDGVYSATVTDLDVESMLASHCFDAAEFSDLAPVEVEDEDRHQLKAVNGPEGTLFWST